MQTPKQKVFPWVMWILGTIFYCFEFFLQVSPAVMLNDLMTSFSVNALAISILASLYFYAYAGMQIPAGILLDRLGPKKLLTLAAIACAIGSIIFGSTSLFYIVVLSRFLIGLGSAFAFIGCSYIAARWLPLNRFALLTGALITLGMLGAIGAQTPLALLVNKIGWRESLRLLGYIGFVIALLLYIFVQDTRITLNEVTTSHKKKSILENFKVIIKNKQNLSCAICSGLMYTPTPIFGTIWGISFIMAKYGISKPFAASIASILYIGWIIGSPITGWLSDYFQKRTVFMLTGIIVSFFSLLIIIFLPPIHYSLMITAIALFVLGFFSTNMTIGFSIIRETNPPNLTGASLGFMNFFNMLGVALIPPLIGLILDFGTTNGSINHFTLTSYQLALSILPLLLVIAFIAWIGIRETHAKFKFIQTTEKI